MHWLGQDFEFVPLSAGLLEKIGSGGLTGKQENFASGNQLADLNGRFDSVHIGHDDVADNQIRTCGSSAVDGSKSRVYRRCLKAVLIQDDRQCVGNNSFIIDY